MQIRKKELGFVIWIDNGVLAIEGVRDPQAPLIDSKVVRVIKVDETRKSGWVACKYKATTRYK